MAGFIAHLDADAFYVSAERVRHADLAKKPVGVLGNNGACVIAKSYEMKAKGVKTGTPIWDAAKLCPEGVYVKRDFYWYEVLSRKMLGIVGTFSPRLEYFSIDEFFFHAEPLRHGQSLATTATTIRDHILEATGLPVTIGVARTRTLAKLFSDTGKPFGSVAVLTRDHERELLAKLPVTEISGIGGNRAERLAPYGIRTCLDLADADGRLVKRLLTKTGHEIWLELNGTPVMPVRPERPPHQVLGRGGSLMGNVEDPQLLWAWCVRHVERLIEELRYHNVRTTALAVEVGWKKGGWTGGTSHIPTPTDRIDELLDAARMSLRRAYVEGRTATHMQVMATELRRGKGFQMSLFDKPDPRREKLADVKAAINEKCGRRQRFTCRPCTATRLTTTTSATCGGRCASDMRAIALPTSELPDEVVEQLHVRVYTRGDQKEVRFDWRAVPALLPVWWSGKLQIIQWGNRDWAERKLPPTGWTWRETVEKGKWAGVEPEPVEIPANYVLANGVWFRVREGLRGLLVRTQTGMPAVFIVCEPATRYYRVMTRAEWMPVLIGEVI